MNTNDDHSDEHTDEHSWENEMSSAFDRRVRDLHEAPLSLDNVKGRAGAIQRKRRTAIAAGILATAAVIVPVAVATGNGLGTDASQDAPVATNTPTAIDTPTETPSTPTVPQGPGFAYLQGADYHRADGTVVRLPAATYESAATLGDQVVAAGQTNGAFSIDVIEGGEVVDSYESTASFVTSRDGTLVAFLRADGDVQTLWAGGEKVLPVGADTPNAFPIAVTGDDCVTQCRVYVDFGDLTQAPTSVDQDGTVIVPVPDAIGINAVTPEGDLVAAQISYTYTGSCSTVSDSASQRVVFETCDYAFEELSPDGRYAIATDAYGDGFGPTYFVVLDLQDDGAEVARYAIERGGIFDMRWLGDDTVVARVYDFGNGSWRIITKDVTSPGDTFTTVLGPEKGNDVDPPFVVVD